MGTLTTQTPMEIDNAYVAILIRADKVDSLIENAKTTAREYLPGGKYNLRGTSFQWERRVAEAQAKRPGLMDQYAAIMAEGAPHREEYARRPWTRFAICKSDGGHVHKMEWFDSHLCSTLRPTSVMAWMPDFSGLTEDELIDRVGITACTVCFPSAPASPAWTRTAKAAKAEQDAARLAKWEAGYAVRVKKVANTEKRLAASLAQGDSFQTRYLTDDVRYAKREVARWEAKKPR
jgi:hypothetical protein